MNPAPKAGLPLAGLFQTWRSRTEAGFRAEDYHRLSQEANNHGASLVAFDIAEEGLQRFPSDPQLVQMKALALARLGSGEAARGVLEELRDAGNADQETLGMIARTYKDAWLETGKLEYLEQAHQAYASAYKNEPDHYWTGINAATLSFALNKETPRTLAETLLADCRAMAEKHPDDDWLPATMAEAHLLLGNLDKAASLYEQARRTAALGNVIAMWRNAQIITRIQGGEAPRRIERALRPPKVALLCEGWSGDLDQCRADLLHEGVAVAFANAAGERDLAFLELVQSLDGQTHIVLPYNEEQFVRERLSGLGDRYRTITARAHDVIVCSDHELRSSNIGEIYAGDVLRGLAQIRARQMDTGLVEIGEPRPPAPSPPSGAFTTTMRAMLFADAFHFSHLTERQIPVFITQVMDQAAAIARNFAPRPDYQNTWGDGLFFAFADVADAGHFALRLSEGAGAIDRAKAGLPQDMNLRIGLHAGPVYKFNDQVIERGNYIGWHVTRAARIEPKTPPGRIYASEAFAALATRAAPGQFRFNYVGRQALAKDFGTSPLYELRDRG